MTLVQSAKPLLSSTQLFVCLVVQEHHLRNGYQLLYTPHVAKADMWKTSGHLDFYAENMYDRIKVHPLSVTQCYCRCTLHTLMSQKAATLF